MGIIKKISPQATLTDFHGCGSFHSATRCRATHYQIGIPENVNRLLTVLHDLDAVARGDPRRLRPNQTHLIGPGHVLMETRFGDFDCLGAIDGSRAYEDLIPAALAIDVEGRPVLFLNLREILEVKRRAGRPKDLAVIPYIESTIDELESPGQG